MSLCKKSVTFFKVIFCYGTPIYIAILLLIGISGLNLTTPLRAEEWQGLAELGPSYDELYPYYMKYCSTTKYHPFKGKGTQGTMAGHGLYYLKGVCKDEARGPSSLKLCEEGLNFADPELGVGISVNKALRNVNFLVIPSRSLFLGAPMADIEVMDLATKERIIAQAVKSRIFKGVEFYPSMLPADTQGERQEEYIARLVFGSDYAVSLARNLYCINVPMNRPAMGSVVDFLNGINEGHGRSLGQDYRGVLMPSSKGDNDYHWNVLFDNCVHPAWNALAQLGLLKPKAVNAPILRQIFNVTIPANTVLDIYKSANRKDIDVDRYYKNHRQRYAFRSYHWMAQQPGTLSETIPLYQPNEIYKKDNTMLLVPSLFERRHKMFHKMCSDPRFCLQDGSFASIATNLRYFQQKYRQAQDKLRERRQSRRYQILARRGTRAELNSVQAEITALQQASQIDAPQPALRSALIDLAAAPSAVSASAASEAAAQPRPQDPMKVLRKLQKELPEREAALDYVGFVEEFGAHLDGEMNRINAQLFRYLGTLGEP